jgi:CheY-like chemotaxis protein
VIISQVKNFILIDNLKGAENFVAKRKLLLADDSITIQKVVNLTFADEGIEVISVGDGNSALDKIREDLPDLVMADVNMPGLNGYEICEKIKQGTGKNETPVILLVGSFEPFDEDEAKRVGADDYLTKPFQSISQLVEKVTELLKLKDAQVDTQEIPAASNENSSDDDDVYEITDQDADEISQMVDEFDDEMIQTNQVGSLPINDISKFESTLEMPNFDPDDALILEEPRDFGLVDEVRKRESEPSSDIRMDEVLSIQEREDEMNDFNKTQPLTNSEYQSMSLEPSPDEEEMIKTENSKGFEFVPMESDTGDLPLPEAASVLELDEFNLLDLPPLEGVDEDESEDSEEKNHFGDSSEDSDDDEISLESVDENQSLANEDSGDDDSLINQESAREPDQGFAGETRLGEKYSVAAARTTEEFVEPVSDVSKQMAEVENHLNNSDNSTNETIDKAVSAEMVEAITRRVIERLSEKAIKEIAWEVVPQFAELIVKKMVEEKMKD